MENVVFYFVAMFHYEQNPLDIFESIQVVLSQSAGNRVFIALANFQIHFGFLVEELGNFSDKSLFYP
jgi:hypothetical protein